MPSKTPGEGPTGGDYSTEPGAIPEGEVTENDDGTVTVAVAPPPEDVPEETYNLVSHFQGSEEGKKFLKELSDKVIRDFDDDWDSCSKWRKKRETRLRLLVGDLPPKEFPWEDAANVHMPVMLERVLRLVHRLYSELFPDRDLIFSAIASTNLNQERADILTLHDNWQFRKEIPDFGKQNRRALMEFIANGDAVMWSYRDIASKRNRHETLSCEEIVWPYVWKTSTIDMSDIPRKTRIVQKYKHELLEGERAGAYADLDTLFEKQEFGDSPEDGEKPVREAMQKYEGREVGQESKSWPYELLEYHGWCKLPGGDDERPVVATVHAKTKVVLCLFMREQEDWKDRARYEKQVGDLAAYQAQQQAFSEMQAQEQALQQRLTMPDVPPDEAQALMAELAKTPPAPPELPKWLKEGMTEPEPVRRVPIEYGSHGVCIENLDGSLGLGIGLLLEEFNKSANTAASQFADSATLANVATAIMPENVRMEPGDNVFHPGEIHKVRGLSPDQINNAIKIIQFPPANPQLLEVVRLAMESADGVSSAPDVLSGEPGKSNETYRGIATRVEQATKQLTVLAMNYLEMVTNVIKNNARLNAVFLDASEMKSVVDPRTLESVDIEVGRGLYAEDYNIAFTADVRFGGRAQKISEADELVAMIGAIPPPLQPIIFPPSFVYEAVCRSLKARGAHDMIRFMGPRPPVPGPGTSPFAGGAPGAGPPMPGGPPPGPPPGPGGPPGAPPRPPGPPQGPPPGSHPQGPPRPMPNGPPNQPIQGPPAVPIQ